jgi:hypothetical protein
MTNREPSRVPVLLDTADPGSSERHRAALATLPAWYTLSDTAVGAVAVVSGARPEWARYAIRCLDDGALALLIIIGDHLDLPGLDAIERAAQSAGAAIAADLEYAADPAWASLAGMSGVRETGLIDGLAATGEALRAAAIRLIVTLAVLGPVPALELVAEGPDHLVLASRARSLPVTLAVTRDTGPGGQRLDLVSQEIRYEARWPDRPRSAAAEVFTHTAVGTARSTLSFEASERGTWQRLHPGGRHDGAGLGIGQLRAALEAASFGPAAVPR